MQERSERLNENLCTIKNFMRPNCDWGGGIVINSKTKKVLLVMHEKVGVWSFPKGGVEARETLEQTAIREIMEETGVKTLKLLKAFPGFIRGNVVEKDLVKEINLFLFLTDEHITKPGAKISKNEWVDVDDVYGRLSYQEDKEFFDNIKNEIKKL